MRGECRHRNVQLWFRWFGQMIDHRPRLWDWTRDGHDAESCLDCGAWLSLGEANDDDPNVQIELRATLLADAWKPIGGIKRISTADEREGWMGWPHRSPRNDGEVIGFLAAQIHHHWQDLGDVNWAGSHMEPAHTDEEGA